MDRTWILGLGLNQLSCPSPVCGTIKSWLLMVGSVTLFSSNSCRSWDQEHLSVSVVDFEFSPPSGTSSTTCWFSLVQTQVIILLISPGRECTKSKSWEPLYNIFYISSFTILSVWEFGWLMFRFHTDSKEEKVTCCKIIRMWHHTIFSACWLLLLRSIANSQHQFPRVSC